MFLVLFKTSSGFILPIASFGIVKTSIFAQQIFAPRICATSILGRDILVDGIITSTIPLSCDMSTLRMHLQKSDTYDPKIVRILVVAYNCGIASEAIWV